MGSADATALTWRGLLAEAESRLGSDGGARRLVEHASGHDGARLALHLDETAPARAVPYLRAMVERRLAGEPLQYVLGRWGFRTLDLLVDRRVLIPRPETEVLVGVALEELRRIAPDRPPLVVDLGTGSGAIALALAVERPDAAIWATDVSVEALAVARSNLAGAGSRVGPRVSLCAGDWFGALPARLAGAVDMIVANPPYVGASEWLPGEVADWEPLGALVSGPQGTEAVAHLVNAAPHWLARPGVAVIEIAPHQAEMATAAAAAAGMSDVEVRLDLQGRLRILVGRC